MGLSPLTDPVLSDSNVFLFLEVVTFGGEPQSCGGETLESVYLEIEHFCRAGFAVLIPSQLSGCSWCTGCSR